MARARIRPPLDAAKSACVDHNAPVNSPVRGSPRATAPASPADRRDNRQPATARLRAIGSPPPEAARSTRDRGVPGLRTRGGAGPREKVPPPGPTSPATRCSTPPAASPVRSGRRRGTSFQPVRCRAEQGSCATRLRRRSRSRLADGDPGSFAGIAAGVCRPSRQCPAGDEVIGVRGAGHPGHVSAKAITAGFFRNLHCR